jgi:hypothetical protein
MEELPVIVAAINLIIAIPMLAANAAYIEILEFDVIN